jgi:hypothetical protein
VLLRLEARKYCNYSWSLDRIPASHSARHSNDSGGTVVETDAAAQAVIGHNTESPDRLEVVEYLLDIDTLIDVYAHEKEDPPNRIILVGLETPLQIATRGMKSDMAELLLKRGTDKSIIGDLTGVAMCISKGETVLEIAEMKGFNKILTLLKEY